MKNLYKAAATAVALLALPALYAVAADDYPTRPVTIVVPFPPGASNDTLARYEADVLGRALHGSFVVENRTGASGEIGISFAAKANADGYTLLHAPSAIVLLPYAMKSVSYDIARDFAPVTLVGLTKFCLVVSPSLPVNSVADLIKLAKAKPGELTFASAGIATPHQIFAEQFKIMTGTDMRHIPYKGAVPGLTDVASGNVSLEFADLTPALPLIQAGKLKLIAVASSKRMPSLPDTPALSEFLPGFESVAWYGIVAPPQTPKDIIAKINTDVNEALKQPDVQARLKPLSADIFGGSVETTSKYMHEEIDRWGKVIKAANIKLQQ